MKNSSEELEKKLKEYFSFYQEKVLSKIRTIKEVTQWDDWGHWLLTHTEWVVFRWIYFALSLNENPIPVIFACACHDLARTDDEYNEIHWPKAVSIVKKLTDMFNDILTEDEKEKIIYAVENHTTWKIAPDYISACLRDADRTRISRDWTYHEKFFNTPTWKKIAQEKPEIFLSFENKILWREKNDDRELVLIRNKF